MKADLLERLDAVKATGPGSWRARCPGHGSKGRTLAIREAEDGRVLLHCFGGCSPLEVLNAVGLQMTDLFPEPLPEIRGRPRFPAADVLASLYHEFMVVKVIACDMQQGQMDDDRNKRLTKAIHRIQEGMTLCRV